MPGEWGISALFMLIRRFWDGKKMKAVGAGSDFPVGWVELGETHQFSGDLWWVSQDSTHPTAQRGEVKAI